MQMHYLLQNRDVLRARFERRAMLRCCYCLNIVLYQKVSHWANGCQLLKHVTVVHSYSRYSSLACSIA